MSVKIKLTMDTVDKPMEGYLLNDDAYGIRDKIYEAMVRYEEDKDDDNLTKKTRKQIRELFYDDDEI